jgi:hypothetical protein
MVREQVETGDWVECDLCAKDLTNDPTSGGFMFGPKGVGPCCAARLEATARRVGEEAYITARCPEGKSFADWIREDIRGGQPGVVTILTDEDAENWLRGQL